MPAAKKNRTKLIIPVQPEVQPEVVQPEVIQPEVVQPEVLVKKRASTKKKTQPVTPLTVPPNPSEMVAKTTPKTSKIVTKQTLVAAIQQSLPNIILHLKCSMSDLNDYNNKLRTYLSKPLEYNPDIPPEIESYEKTHMEYTQITEEQTASRPAFPVISNSMFPEQHDVPETQSSSKCACCADTEHVDAASNKEINQKLKQMKIMLYKNSLQEEKKSACFWCTCDYDNAACRIPKYEMDDTIYGYGSFCRPECGVAFLFREPLDDSTKFERYQLMNKIYGPVYKYKKNIKPAPDPYYLLDKFYGNMSIQEYRKLLKTDHLLLIIDKPLTRVLPEMHEDTDETILNIYGITKTAASSTTASGVYKVKRQSEKQTGPSKTSIIRDTFGL